MRAQAQPHAIRLEDCDFYHAMYLPGVGKVDGQWDLRGHVDEYLGYVDLAGKRVLEIGPASGFLTALMEARGADVLAIEVPDDPGWDFVPYPASVIEPAMDSRRAHMRRLKNSFWFTHRAFDLRACLLYGRLANLPASLARFDVAVMAAVLLHARDPLSIVEACSKLAHTLVIVETFHPGLDGPVCHLHPTPESKALDTWWDFSPEFLTRFLAILGFGDQTITYHRQQHASGSFGFFTIVAHAA
jgi:hypothetical protein